MYRNLPCRVDRVSKEILMMVTELATSPSNTPGNPQNQPPINATITVMTNVAIGAHVS